MTDHDLSDAAADGTEPGHPAAVGDEHGASPPPEHAPRGPVFWVGLVVGWGLIVFALHGMISNAGGADPPGLFRTLIGLNVVNDAVVVPVALAVAVAAHRLLPRWALVPVQVGLFTSAVVTVYAVPLVGGWGRSAAAGASRLPWNYAHSLEMVLGAVWLVCAVMAAWSWKRAAPRA